jgi:glycolate oxidase
MRIEEIREDIAAIVGEDHVSDALFERMLYDHDIAPIPPEVSILFKTLPDLVVKPREIEELSQVVEYADAHGIPLTPRGASSWGYGGAVPTRGGIVLELTELNRIVELDEGEGSVTVEAGLRWGRLLNFLEERGLTLRVYPSSAPSATIGGWIATGGLGIGSLKHGHLREHVKGLRVVTPMGQVLNLARGDRLFDSLFGSEGTLGVVAQATLAVHPKPERLSPQLASFEDREGVMDVVTGLIERERKPLFIEIQDRGYLELKRAIDLFAPEAEALTLCVFEGSKAEVQEDVDHLRKLVSEAGGTLLPEGKALEEWEERFYPMRIKRAGPTLLAGEVLIPLSQLSQAFEGVDDLKERYGLRMGVKCFMVSEGEALFMPMYLADERERWRFLSLLPVADEITSMGLELSGRPYGFGLWNSFYLGEVYEDREIRAMRELKRKLDPNDIMNPGKIYGVRTRFGIPLWRTTYRILISLLRLLRHLRR